MRTPEWDAGAEPTDAQLLAGVIERDDDAFAMIHRRYEHAVRLYAYDMVKSRAPDIAQEVWITFHQDPAKVTVHNGSALPWLLTTCKNKARNFRRLKRETEIAAGSHPGDDTTPGPETIIEHREFAAAVADALDDLPERDGQLFKQYLEGDHTNASLAAAHGVTVGSVRNRLSRTRALLRKTLKPFGEA